MTVLEILSKAGETEQNVLHEHAILLCMANISKYEAEYNRLKNKYGEPLEVVNQRIQAQKQTENFDIEDDLIDWEYADTALKWWHNRAEELRRAC